MPRWWHCNRLGIFQRPLGKRTTWQAALPGSSSLRDMAMTTKLKGRLVALLLLAVVLALPVLRLVQRRAEREENAPPPPPVTKASPSPTGKPPRSKPSSKAVPEEIPVPEAVPSEEALAALRESARERLQEFRAADTSTERKRELMEALVSAPVALDELWNAIGSLPEGERSDWYARLADRSAKEQPAKFFQTLDELSPGSQRSEVIQAGVASLDSANLQRMMDQVRKQGDEEEIAGLAQNFLTVENSALKSAELLDYARKLRPAEDEEESLPGAPAGLRDSLAYGAGMLDASTGGKTDLNRLRRDFGDEAAERYAEGLGTALMENTEEPEKFTGFLAESNLSVETRLYLVNGFASHALQGGTTEALALGGKLAANDADTYYQELGRQLAERDSAEAARVVGKLPAGRAREVMAAQLAKHLESQGEGE